MNRVEIPNKKASETILLGQNGNSPFNFVSALSPNEIITVASVVCTVYSGNDPSPASVINGAAGINGQQVTQSITGGITGVIYELACTVNTNDAQVLKLTGYLAIIPDLT